MRQGDNRHTMMQKRWGVLLVTTLPALPTNALFNHNYPVAPDRTRLRPLNHSHERWHERSEALIDDLKIRLWVFADGAHLHRLFTLADKSTVAATPFHWLGFSEDPAGWEARQQSFIPLFVLLLLVGRLQGRSPRADEQKNT